MLTKLEQAAPWAIAVFRIVVGFLFFSHGASSLFGWFAQPYGGDTVEFGVWPSWWAAIIQFVTGAAIILGGGTRVAALIGSGSMAVAYFWKHQPDGLTPIANDGDSAALFCWALLLLVFVGPGALALDGLRARRTPASAPSSDSEPVAAASA